MVRLANMFSEAMLQQPLGRRSYVTAGLGLMALKYAVDATTIVAVTGIVWTPLDYLVPMMSLVGNKVAQFPSWLNIALLMWTAPFVWIGDEIEGAPEWYFRFGLAYPLRARIVGSGVGAVRYCEFTTGAFRDGRLLDVDFRSDCSRHPPSCADAYKEEGYLLTLGIRSVRCRTAAARVAGTLQKRWRRWA